MVRCPACRVRLERSPEAPLPPGWECRRCGTGVILRGQAEPVGSEKLSACVVCGGQHFYVEKDFPKPLRWTFMGLAIGLSFWTYGISIFAAAGLDFLLYRVLPFYRVCYLCQAEYRGYAHDPSLKAFDPHSGVAYDARRTTPYFSGHHS